MEDEMMRVGCVVVTRTVKLSCAWFHALLLMQTNLCKRPSSAEKCEMANADVGRNVSIPLGFSTNRLPVQVEANGPYYRLRSSENDEGSIWCA